MYNIINIKYNKHKDNVLQISLQNDTILLIRKGCYYGTDIS